MGYVCMFVISESFSPSLRPGIEATHLDAMALRLQHGMPAHNKLLVNPRRAAAPHVIVVGQSVHVYVCLYVYSESAHLDGIALCLYLRIASTQQGSSFKFGRFRC